MRSTGLIACGALILLVACGAHAAAPKRSAGLQEAVNAFLREFNKTKNPYLRAEALLNMKEFDEPAFVDFLIDIVRQTPYNRSNFIIRHTAAQKISKLKSEETLQRVLACLARSRTSRQSRVSLVLVRGLGANPSPIAAKGILEGLKDPGAKVKAAAAGYAGRLKDVEAIPLLIGLLAHRDKRVSLHAYNALVELTGCQLAVKKKSWEAWWEQNGANVKELPVAEELRAQEKITSWPMLADFNFGCRSPSGKARALNANAYPAFRRPVTASIASGLKWLADHQSEEGYWDVDEYWVNDPKYKGVTLEQVLEKRKKGEPPIWGEEKFWPGIGTVGTGMDLPATAFALMAFCGNGSTHRHGAYKKTVQKAIDWMLEKQNEKNGSFSNNMYVHSICAHALIELWGMTRDLKLKAPAQRAADFLCYAQNEGAGWRYSPKSGSSDSSVSSWCTMALQTARRSDLEVPAENLIWCRGFWDKVTVYSQSEGAKEFGQAFYELKADGTTGGAGSYANTAGSILCRIFMGTMHRARSVRAGAIYLDDASTSALVPNVYMWIYTTQALFQIGGKQWARWERDVMPAVAELQKKTKKGKRTGDEGSFWTDTRWISKSLGRVGVTAACCIVLETYYFYPKIKNE